MQVPKRKTSKSRKGTRRAHHALTPIRSSKCGHCGEPVLPHHICKACGYYGKTRKILAVETAAE